ncbi:MAG: CpsD/CapB family tyrosine-protein kinase [bacterium]|nr:CpsD/CapB family tyrosine-protein kinase [bacterium]
MGKIHDALQRAEQQRSSVASTATPLLREGSGTATDRGSVSAPSKRTEIRKPREETRRERRARKKLRIRTERGKEDHSLEAQRPRVLIGSTASNVTEEYRTLRARIQSVRRTRTIASLVITSARPDEGKTTTAINLALSFGMDREMKTCLVDADLRTPGVSKVFGPTSEVGLAEVLETDAKLSDALIELPDSRLSVLPVRALPTYPSELLGSARMAQLLEELAGHFEMIIIDAPPVLGLADSVSLLDACDAALFVVGAGSVSRADVDAALERLDTSKLIGTVFNRCEAKQSPYGTYGKD